VLSLSFVDHDPQATSDVLECLFGVVHSSWMPALPLEPISGGLKTIVPKGVGPK